MEFRDRRHAGRLLAAQLQPLTAQQPIVVALPRGGVPVAYEIAQSLGAPLDVLAVRKIGAPGNPEFGVGAIAEDGTAVLDPERARRTGMTQQRLDAVVADETRELLRRVATYRGRRAPLDVRGRTVIVVDDGIATGLTDLAAVRALRKRGAAEIIVAVPVGARESVAMVDAEADAVACHLIPHDLLSVGQWYEDFSPVSDGEVIALLNAARGEALPAQVTAPRALRLALGDLALEADLTVPDGARGLVIFAHGSGSSRLSPRNRAVATALNEEGFATLLLDLLTPDEARRRELVFDIALLAWRLELATRWVREQPVTHDLPIGYFGASTGAAAALRAAATPGNPVQAIVSRGGRPDLAGDRLAYVEAPTLLIVGGNDTQVLDLNRQAAAQMRCPVRLRVVPRAGHLFEEPGTLEQVAELAGHWFGEHLHAWLAATGS